MLKKTKNKKIIETSEIINDDFLENFTKSPISEQTVTYGQKPFSIFYNNPEHSLKLLKGDCIEILNRARENSVDMIFADPPYFLSNGGITCHAGKMVSVNKGKWDKSKGIKESHEFILEWLKAFN